MAEVSLLEAFVGGLVSVFTWPTFGYLLIGVAIGFVVGILPGLGGPVALALMLPFTFGMQPVEAFAFLLGMTSVTATTGDVTAILFGVPGEVTSAALVIDGHPLSKQGQAGRALGAVLTSSLVGALIGAFTLAAAIPIVRPVVLALGSPEFFMLTLLGMTVVGALSGGAVLKGLIAGAVGLLLGTVGLDPQSGVQRYTFGQLHLWDGVGLVAVAVGLFAIPEVVDLYVRGAEAGERRVGGLGGVMDGVRDTFRHRWLTVRCSVLGALIGILPGLGGAVAQWIAYAHAVQSSPGKERFGKGAIEGVLGPGAANNSKEGGNLIPTVAFGVPSTMTMAILLGAFLIQGIAPGPTMLTTNVGLTMSFVWLIVVSNVIAVAICFLFVRPLAGITTLRSGLLIPPIALLVYVGAFAEKNTLLDLTTTLAFGLLGLVMVALGWPRPPLILGLVLGRLMENYLFLSTNRYGAEWLGRPLVLVFIALAMAAVLLPLVRGRLGRRAGGELPPLAEESTPAHAARPGGDALVAAVILMVAAAAAWEARDWEPRARLFPWVIAIPLLGLAAAQLALALRAIGRGSVVDAAAPPASRRAHVVVGWLLGFAVAIWLLGFPIGGPLAALAYLRFEARESWPLSLATAAGSAAFFWAMLTWLHTPFPPGAALELLSG